MNNVVTTVGDLDIKDILKKAEYDSTFDKLLKDDEIWIYLLSRDFPNKYMTPMDKYMFFYRQNLTNIKKQVRKLYSPLYQQKTYYLYPQVETYLIELIRKKYINFEDIDTLFYDYLLEFDPSDDNKPVISSLDIYNALRDLIGNTSRNNPTLLIPSPNEINK